MLDLLLSTMINMQDLNTEVQVNICDSENSLSQKIDLSQWAHKRSISTHYVESRELGLYKQALVFRIRLDLNKNKAEVTLKHNTPIELSSSFTEAKGKKCEYDLHGVDLKLACKIENKVTIAEFNKAMADNQWKSLLNEEQIAWVKSENIKFPENLTFTTAFEENSYTYDKDGEPLELSIVTNELSHEFIEASVRVVKIDDVDKFQHNLLNYLNHKQVDLCKDQSAMLTRKKLESFFKRSN